MPAYEKLHSITLIAAAAIANARLVSRTGSHAASSIDVAGISEQAAKAGSAFSAITSFSGLVEAAEVIPQGAPVKPAADGSGRVAVGTDADSCGWAVAGASKAGAMATIHVVENRGSGAGAGKTPDAVYFDCLCDDGAGLAKDRSGRANHILPGVSNAAPWVTAGYLATGAGAAQGAFIPLSKFQVDMRTDSFYLSFTINTAATGGSNKTIAGWGNTTTGYGIYFSARDPSGTIVPVLNGSGGAFSSLVSGYNLGSQCDGADHHLGFGYDAFTRSAYYWIDGKIALIVPNCLPAQALASLNASDFTLGANNGAGGTSVAAKFKNIRMLKFSGLSLPNNISEIARKSFLRPDLLLTSADIGPSPTKWLSFGWVGQSNEATSADYPDFTVGGFGSPQKDTILPSGWTSLTPPTTSSWHVGLSRLVGERGVWLDTLNTARGTTSLVQMWCGSFSAWSASTTFGLGAYVIAASKVFKLTSSSGSSPNLAATGASGPAWPAAGTVVDGEATWTFVRAATGADVVGTVLDMSNPLFDPNGYMTNATNVPANLAGIMSYLPQRPVGDKAIAISIGQGDKTLGSTGAQYQAAIVNVTNWALSKGWKVFIGLTCDGATPGYSAYLSGVLQPAKNAALASFFGNPNVFDGADLLRDLGPLTVTQTAIGLLPDQLHLNSMGRDAAAAAWNRALKAAGY